MTKKLIVALLCLIITLIAFISGVKNGNLTSAGEKLILAMHNSPRAVAVFNLDRGVFI